MKVIAAIKTVVTLLASNFLSLEVTRQKEKMQFVMLQRNRELCVISMS